VGVSGCLLDTWEKIGGMKLQTVLFLVERFWETSGAQEKSLRGGTDNNKGSERGQAQDEGYRELGGHSRELGESAMGAANW